MGAPLVCSECSRGWRLNRVETIEGEEEWAWELCPECEGGDAFPPGGRQGGVSVEYPEGFTCDHVPGSCDQHACSNGDPIQNHLSRRFISHLSLPRPGHLEA